MAKCVICGINEAEGLSRYCSGACRAKKSRRTPERTRTVRNKAHALAHAGEIDVRTLAKVDVACGDNLTHGLQATEVQAKVEADATKKGIPIPQRWWTIEQNAAWIRQYRPEWIPDDYEPKMSEPEPLEQSLSPMMVGYVPPKEGK